MYPIRQQSAQVSTLANLVLNDYQIIRLKNPPHSTYYYRLLSSTSHTLSYLDEETAKLLLRPYLEEHLGGFSASFLSQASDTLFLSVKEEKEMKDLYNLIEISPTLYWDNQHQALRRRDDLAPHEVSFFRLFDSRFYTEHRPEVNPTFITAAEVLPRYHAFLEQIEALSSAASCSTETSLDFSPILPEELSFMNAWTKGNPDILSDILRMIATIFMKRKPLGSFCLIGKARGGKSACVNMLHTLLGSRNTSLVKMSQLNDDHYTHQLLHSLLNAPDEEDDTKLDRQQANFKGVSLDTLIPTPDGYTTMGELKEGDIVFDKDFNRVVVEHKSEVHYNPCYEISLNGGEHTTIIADHEHRWLAQAGQKSCTKERVYTTEELLAKLKEGKRVRIYNPVDRQDDKPVPLPVDPYVLGAWLGDGCRISGEIAKKLPALFEEIKRRGYKISENRNAKNGRCPLHTVYGLVTQLREAGVYGNKHLPMQFLRASASQRLDLLRGLMDTDGFFRIPAGYNGKTTGGRAVMSTTQEWQKDAVVQLVSSLGWTPTVQEVYRTGFGKKVKVYDVVFTPTVNPFLVRNQDVRFANPCFGATFRRVKAIKKIETVPTQCIQVSSPSHTYLIGKEHIVTHNTLSDHGTLTLSRMGSNEPLYLTADFTSIFPMNHMPEWRGTGTEACMRRTLAIPFLADLSSQDNRSSHFERDTYTHSMYAQLLPLVLAIATFYSAPDRKMVFSPTMRSYQQFMEEETSSASVYFKLFERYFNGFTTVSLIYTDYVNWCKIREYKIQTRKEFQFFFNGFLLSKATNRTVSCGKKKYKLRCFVGTRPLPILHPEFTMLNMNDHTLAQYHELGGSALERMQAKQEELDEQASL